MKLPPRSAFAPGGTPVTGLFGWVSHNTTRSLVLLLGFVVLMQLLAVVVLFMPLLSIDPEHAPRYAWAGYASRYVPAVALSSVVLFGLQMWWHLAQVRGDLGFHFVDNTDEPRLCALVEPLAIAAGMPEPYVGVLNNAALNGFSYRLKARAPVLVFSRGIIDGLDDDELESVIAGLLMRVRHNDTMLIAAANVFLRNMGLLDRINVWKPRRYRQIAAVLLAPVLLPLYLGIAILSQLCLRLGLASRLLISTARAYIADAEAVELTQNPAALVSALHAMEGRSTLAGLKPEHDAMMLDGMTAGSMATHPRIAERIQAIVAVTGQMALDSRPRRDTRAFSGTRAAGFGRAAQGLAALEQVAVQGAVPQAGSFKAFARVGNQLNILGLRWDLSVALLATFCTSLVLHRGDLGGYLSQFTHVFDRPDNDTKWLIDNALACKRAEMHGILNRAAPADACAMSPALIAHAAAKNIQVTPDGRVLTASQVALLSPEELQGKPGAAGRSNGFFNTSTDVEGPAAVELSKPATDLRPVYALPMHEAWLRLARGDLTPALRLRQCGILIHAHRDAVPDQSVTWSITSEGSEQIRFTATLQPDRTESTHLALAIEDKETLSKLQPPGNAPTYDIALHPALRPPLRPFLAAALTALLERHKLREADVMDPAIPDAGTKTTSEICAMQRSGLEMGEHFSIHSREATQ